MNSKELDDLITAFNRKSRNKWLLILIWLFIVFFAVFSCTIAKLPFWSLAVTLFASTIAMSVILTRVTNNASNSVGLVCPHCGEPLGGSIKSLKKGICSSCRKQLCDPEDLIYGPPPVLSFSDTKKVIIKRLILCSSIIVIFGSICVYGIVEGEVIAASKRGFVVRRVQDPFGFWFSEAVWFFPCGLFAYALVGYFKRIPKLLAGAAQPSVQADRPEKAGPAA